MLYRDPRTPKHMVSPPAEGQLDEGGEEARQDREKRHKNEWIDRQC